MEIGFHTAGFNSAYTSFEKCLQWAHERGIRFVECGMVDGVVWAQGMGFYPHVASWQEPGLLRRKMDELDVHLSQIDAAFPLSDRAGMVYGPAYVLNTIRWAALAGCTRVDTTDGMDPPDGMDDEEALATMQRAYERIVEAAECYDIVINIEPHGHFTTRPEVMERMLDFCDSPNLRLNFDTGNTYIAGQEPVAFCRRFADRIDHVHVKDVAPALAAAARGEETGIGMSHCAVGEGVNADNIRDCLTVLRDAGYAGVLSVECEAQGGPQLERSVRWLAETLDELNIPHATPTLPAEAST